MQDSKINTKSQENSLRLLKIREVMQLTRRPRDWLNAHLDEFEIVRMPRGGIATFQLYFTERSVHQWIEDRIERNGKNLTARQICESEMAD